jgi:hypothetical protein
MVAGLLGLEQDDDRIAAERLGDPIRLGHRLVAGRHERVDAGVDGDLGQADAHQHNQDRADEPG